MKFPKKVVVISLIIGGKIIAPEASAILSHYCFGNGDTLYLNSEYIKKSPVVLKSIKKLKKVESHTVTFRQNEDWRLSYALNPFEIKKISNGYLIYQYIKFDSKGSVHTKLNLGFTEIEIKDNIVHAFDCTPFVAVCKFKY